MDKIKVIIYGCGVMGRQIAQVLHEKRSFEVVGAVDIAPELAEKDLGQSFDPPQTLGVVVEKDAGKLFSKTEAQAVVLTTTSHLKDVFSQITQCLEAG